MNGFSRTVRALAVAAGLALALGTVCASASEDDDDDSTFVQARNLFWSGQYDQAEPLFKTYLLGHPNDEASRAFMQMIVQSRSRNPTRIGATRKQLEGVVIDHLEFKDAEWRQVAAWFQEQANPKKDGKEPENYINFICLLPSSLTVKVTLNLHRITLLRAIHHACEQVGLRYVIDANAVIFDLPEARKK